MCVERKSPSAGMALRPTRRCARSWNDTKLRPDKDVIILQGGGQTERFAALRAGAVDAAIVSPPLNLAARALGLNEVIDLSESGIPYAHQEYAHQEIVA